MKKILSDFRITIFVTLLILSVLTPTFIFAAAEQQSPAANQNAEQQSPAAGQNAGQQSPGQSVGISNPLKVNSIQELISEVLKFAVNLLAIAGVVYIMWTGFLFVKAQGNPEELKKARQSFVNAIIGMAIILGAWAIATVIANTINKITGNKEVFIGTK